MFQVCSPNVSSVLDECCKYFYLIVAKVDLDGSYTCMLQAYVLSIFKCFIHMFASISSRYCLCFHLDVVYVCNGFQMFSGFLHMFQTLILSVSFVFFCIL
jgi:hypothetical protein